MEKKDKQELIAVIEEMCSPLHSAGNLYTQNINTSSDSRISFSMHMSNTVEKRPISEGDISVVDSTERKFICSTGSDSDSDSDTGEATMDSITLMKHIEKLQKEQDELRQKQQIHEQHIRELMEREPYVNNHFKSLRSNLASETNPKLFTHLKNTPLLSSPAYNKQSLLMEEKIYVQLEQLYANFHVLHFPSKMVPSPLSSQKGKTCGDSSSLYEINSLKNKIKELERKLSSTQKSLPQPHFAGTLKAAKSDTRLEDMASPYSSRTLLGVSGRPTSPVPLPQTPAEIFPVEVTFKWIISNYYKKLRQEKLDDGHKEISRPFYLTHCGYRAQVEVYLNGNGTANNRCMSVFLRVVKGDYDRHLKWPVNLHFLVILVNQIDGHSDSLKAEGNQFQYEKPCGSSDGESDIWGLIEFVSHEMIKQRNYISEDKIELKCRIQIL